MKVSWVVVPPLATWLILSPVFGVEGLGFRVLMGSPHVTHAELSIQQEAREKKRMIIIARGMMIIM